MKGRSVHDLLRDYQAATARGKQLPAPVAKEVRDFERFVRGRQHILARDPGQFWSQAWGQSQESAVRPTVASLPGPAERWWFRALWPLPASQWELMIDARSDVLCVTLWEGGGRTIAVAGCHDGMIRRYDLATGEELKPGLVGHVGEVWAVAVSADGRHALSGSEDRTLRCWDLHSGACTHVLEGHTGRVSAVAVSADGRHALSGSADGTLRCWDLDSGSCDLVLQGHTGRVSAVVVSADGRHALSGSLDHTLRWWDLGSGSCALVLRGHIGGVDAVVVSAEGSHTLSGSYDHTLR
jgi:WD40 repeat protein